MGQKSRIDDSKPARRAGFSGMTNARGIDVFTLNQDWQSKMDEQTRLLLSQISTATITTQLARRGICASAMKGPKFLNPWQEGRSERLVGEAYTVRTIPMREDLSTFESLADPAHPLRSAIEKVPKGSVLTIDARGDRTSALLGDILIARLKVRGVAGVVFDGVVRDGAAVAALNFPVVCLGAAAPPSICAHTAVDVQSPIGCGGVAVVPGDIIVADSDGAIVIPKHLAAEIAKGGDQQERLERYVQLRVLRGDSTVGLYPPNEATKASFREWLAAGEPEDL